MNWLFDTFSLYSKRIAIISSQTSFSYLTLLQQIQHYKNDLQEASVFPGEVVALISDYSFESISLFLALWDNQNIIVPILPMEQDIIDKRLEIACVEKICQFTTNQKLLIHSRILSTKSKLIIQLVEDQHAGLILFSSGITGMPKAMLHNLDYLLSVYQNKHQQDYNTLAFLMFDHIGGLDTLFRVLSTGAILTIPKERSVPSICQLIEDHKISILPASPTFFNLLLTDSIFTNYDLSSLKILAYGAEAMPEFVLKKLVAYFPNAKIQQKFGTSETNSFRIKNLSRESLFIKIDDPNVEYKIIENELWLKSKSQILGYLNAPMTNFTEDGWFKTGDLVEQSENGYFKVIGRNNEVINVGGEKAFPAEIESLILQIDGICDCVVYGEPNSITGEMIVADIVVSSSIEANELKRIIRKFCLTKIERYKIPTKINVIDNVIYNKRFKKIRPKVKI